MRWIDVVLICVVWAGMSLFVAPTGDFPINDDWVYAATVRSVLNGHFEVYKFSSANVGPLAYWGALLARLFGFSFEVFRSATWLLAVAATIAIHALFLALWKNRIVALVAALMLAVNPVFFSLALTFMSDVPFVALLACSMLCIARGFERDRDRLVLLGLAIALTSVAMRQFGVIVLAGFGFAHLVRRGVRWQTVVVATVPLALGLLLDLAFTRWLVETGRKTGSGMPTIVAIPTPHMLGQLKWSLLGIVSTTGLFLLPMALLCLPSRGAPRSKRFVAVCAVIAVVTVVLAALFAQRHLAVPVTDNVLNWYGIGPLANRDTLTQKINLPIEGSGTTLVWQAISCATFVAVGCLVAALAVGAGRLGRTVAASPFAVKGADAAISALFVGTGTSYFVALALLGLRYNVLDRYLLPLALVAAASLPQLLRADGGPIATTRGRVVAASACLAVAAAFSVITTHDYFAWSRTRWSAVKRLVEEGISPHRIDGGYEFSGWYLYDPAYVAREPKSWWWVDDDEFVVSSGPEAGYVVFRVLPVDRWWPSGGRDVVILRREPSSESR